MTRFARTVTAALAALLVSALILSAGCAKPAEEKLQPKVAPPAVATAGKLVAGVDLETPPFAGIDGTRKAGFDIDVAAALAEKLGLTITYVDVKPSEAASALAEGTVDVVMSVPLSNSALSSVALAGSYAADGPAFFIATDSTASVEPSLTLDALTAPLVGAQQGSAAFWALRSELGSESVAPFDSLREAVEALDAGDVSVVAGDAFVGAYIIRDFQRVRFAGQLTAASPLSVAVGVENDTLQESVRTALDELAADGVFDALRTKWVGALPELTTGDSVEASATP